MPEVAKIRVIHVKAPANPCCDDMGQAWGHVVYSRGNQLHWIGGYPQRKINVCPFCRTPVEIEDDTAKDRPAA